MIKQLKYALMAFFLIASSKLVQTLFFDQKEKKKFYPKVELVDKDMKSDKAVLDEKREPIKEKTELNGLADTSSVEVNKKQEESFATPNAYPTLEDLKKNYLSIKNAGLQEGRSREDVVIRYYKHEKDENKVYALKKLRYYLHEKPAIETKGLGSNVLYYGNEVKLEDIQVVAYVLLENGIPLKSIERSKYDWKSNAIEIGTDPELIGTENITKDKIRNFAL